MNKKYEILKEDTIEREGKTLYRIRALRDIIRSDGDERFTNLDIKAGALGGYIEDESNLSHEGCCWADEYAYLMGKTEVKDNAFVRTGIITHSIISGNVYVNADTYDPDRSEIVGSTITDNAIVEGIKCCNIICANISGNSWLTESSIFYADVENVGRLYETLIYGTEEQQAKISGENIRLVGAFIKGNADIKNELHVGQIQVAGLEVTFYRLSDNTLGIANRKSYEVNDKLYLTLEEFMPLISHLNDNVQNAIIDIMKSVVDREEVSDTAEKMNPKQFIKLLKSVNNKSLSIQLAISPKSGWQYKLNSYVTEIVAETEYDTVFITNAFSDEQKPMTVSSLIESLEDNEFDLRHIIFEVYGIDYKEKINNPLWSIEPEASDVCITEDESYAYINIGIDYANF